MTETDATTRRRPPTRAADRGPGGHPLRRVTIRDVADATGVAPSTVSRALSMPDRVNRATQQRIQDAARSLGYVPNSQARALTSGRTRAVAVLVSDITNPFYFDVIRGTQHQLAAAGWMQLLVDTEESPGRRDGRPQCDLRQGRRRGPDRVTPVRRADRPVRGTHAPRRREPASGRCPVRRHRHPRRGRAGRAAPRLLGHRDVLYVAGPDSSWSNERRWRALVQVAKRLDVRVGRISRHAPFVDSGARRRRRRRERRCHRLHRVQRPDRDRHARATARARRPRAAGHEHRRVRRQLSAPTSATRRSPR